MAKKKIEVVEEVVPLKVRGRSEAIRAYLADNPNAKNQEVADAVSKQLGVEVKANYVSIVKSSDNKDGAGKRRSKSVGADLEKLALEFALLSAGSLDKAIKAVDAYKEDGLGKFVAACGGIEQAKKVLSDLADRAKE